MSLFVFIASIEYNKRVKRFFYSFKILIPLLLLMSSSNLVFAESPKKELVVAMGLTKPPFIEEDYTGGIEVDIIRKSFENSPYVLKIVHVPQARTIEQFKTDQVDAIATVKNLNNMQGLLSDPYITYHNTVVTKKKLNLKIHGIEDFKKLRVAGFQNAQILLGSDFAKSTNQSPYYKEYPRQEDQLKMLSSERVDVIVLEKNIFYYFAKKLNFNLADYHEHRIFPVNEYRLAVKTEEVRETFNRGLQHLKKTGEYRKLQKFYGIQD